MGNYFKSFLKVISAYSIVMVLSLVFIMPFYKQMHIYSFVFLLIFTLVLYSEMADLAKKESRPQYNIKTYFLKGFVIGLISIIPLVLIIVIEPLINIQTKDFKFGALKDLVLTALFMPVYFIAKIGGKTQIAYLIASAFIPLISGIGYISGRKGVSITEFLSKKFGIKFPAPKKKVRR